MLIADWLTGVVKDWILIAFSWSVIRDQITLINLIGYALSFVGVAWYNNAKLKVRFDLFYSLSEFL